MLLADEDRRIQIELEDIKGQLRRRYEHHINWVQAKDPSFECSLEDWLLDELAWMQYLENQKLRGIPMSVRQAFDDRLWQKGKLFITSNGQNFKIQLIQYFMRGDYQIYTEDGESFLRAGHAWLKFFP